MHRLEQLFGPKLGKSIFDKSCGREETTHDESSTHKSTSVGVNWGVRFDTELECNGFLQSLSNELSDRISGKLIEKLSLKVMIAKDPSLEPKKFLGHGYCTQHSKSINYVVMKSLVENVQACFQKLWQSINVPISSIRGITMTAELLQSQRNKQTTIEDSLNGKYPRKLSEIKNENAHFDCDSKKFKSNQHFSSKMVDATTAKKFNFDLKNYSNIWEIKRTISSLNDHNECIQLISAIFDEYFNHRQYDCIVSVLQFVKRISSFQLYTTACQIAQKYFDNNLKL